MLSKYFEIKTKTKKFDDDLLWSMGEIKYKRVILYGAGEGFIELDKKYDFKNTLNIVAIADKKFENSSDNKEFYGIRTIKPSEIPNEDYDVILITNEAPKPILNYLFNDLNIENKDIRTVFNEEVPDEETNLNFLYQYKFDKTLPKLVKKLKNKTVMLYGGGVFLELIQKYFDLSNLNIVGVADKRFEKHQDSDTFMGYKVYAPSEITYVNPDYVIVSTKNYINIIEDLYYNTLKGSKIRIKPLVKKPFMTLVKEIWS